MPGKLVTCTKSIIFRHYAYNIYGLILWSVHWRVGYVSSLRYAGVSLSRRRPTRVQKYVIIIVKRAVFYATLSTALLRSVGINSHPSGIYYYVNFQRLRRTRRLLYLCAADNMFLRGKVFPSKDMICFRFKRRYMIRTFPAGRQQYTSYYIIFQNRTKSCCDIFCFHFFPRD